MKSRVVGFRNFMTYIKSIADEISKDKVSVYAAQASFFVIISTVPFIALLITLVGVFIPDKDPAQFFDLQYSSGVLEIFNLVLSEIKNIPSISLLSITTVTTLWSASKGIAAIRSGIETVYRSPRNTGIIVHRAKSLLTTVIFIALIIFSVALLLFGDFLIGLIGLQGSVTDIIMKFRIPVFIIMTTILFTAIYSSIAHRSSYVRHGIIVHVPGAFLSSLGWVVFSYFYSLYIAHFPNASYIYGGLAALCLIMLWLYFCMIILLLGAEVNKFFFAKKTIS